MPIDMTRLNAKNFSYYAFNPKAAALSERDKRIVILSHILLSLTCGLGHLVTLIVYGCHKRDFKAELAKLVTAANTTNQLALTNLCPEPHPSDQINPAIVTTNDTLREDKKICERIQVISWHSGDGIRISYGCKFFFNDGTDERREVPKEELLNIILGNKTTFIEDSNHFLSNRQEFPLGTLKGCKVFASIPKVAGLDFPKIDYITVTGRTDLPCIYSCKVINKNGKEEKINLTQDEFNEIERQSLAHIENPFRYWNTPMQKRVDEIEQLTGLDFSIIDKIKVTSNMHCEVTFSNGKTKPWNLKNEQLEKIRETHLVDID